MSKFRHWLVPGGLVVAVMLVSLLSGHRLPLYDGVGFPDEPYRYVVQPPEVTKKTVAPSGVKTVAPVSNGGNDAYVFASSSEYGPQISVTLGPQSVKVPSGASQIIVKAEPLALDKTRPPQGKLVGNIYRVSATSDAGDVRYEPTGVNAGYIVLRLPQGYQSGAVVVYRSSLSDKWSSDHTNKVGLDNYNAPFLGFGDYALATTNTYGAQGSQGAQKAKGFWSSGRIALVLILFSFLAVILATILSIRRQSTKGKKHHGK